MFVLCLFLKPFKIERSPVIFDLAFHSNLRDYALHNSPDTYEFCISTDQKVQLSLEDQLPGHARRIEEIALIFKLLFIFICFS